MATRETHAKQRQRLRRKLEDLGYDDEYIEAVIARKRDEQARARLEQQRARKLTEARQAETWAKLNPDDRRYRPDGGDSTLRGHGRATGTTAVVVKRGRTITKYQHDGASR